MAFATELLARQARQRILYHPDIAAALDRAGRIPRFSEAADGPRSGRAGAGRTVKRDGRAAAPGGEMGHGSIGADIDGGTLEQGCQARPVEAPAHADYRRVGGPPKAIDVGLLGGLAAFGRDHGEPPRRKSTGEPAPAGVGPTPVAVEPTWVPDRKRGGPGGTPGGGILRTDDIRHMVETERSGKAQELCDPMAIGLGRHRDMMRVPLPPRPRLASMRHQPDSATRGRQGEKGRAVPSLRRNSEIVSAP